MDLAGTFAAIQPLGHTIIAVDAPITTEPDALAWKNYLDLVSGSIEQKDAILIVPFDDVDAATAFAAYAPAKTSYRMVAACFHGTTQLAELSASVAAVIAQNPDPAVPYDDLPLLGLTPVTQDKVLSSTRIEAALQVGVAIIANGEDGNPKVVRLLTTCQQTSTGETDDLMIDVNAPMIVAYTRKYIRSLLKSRPRQKNTAAVRKNNRSLILKGLIKLDTAEILQNVKARADELTVTQDATNRSQADYAIPTDIVPGLHINAATLNVYSGL